MEYLYGNRRGFVLNAHGKKCWYVQHPTKDETLSYFYEELKGSDSVMIFEDSKCMSGTDVYEEINIRMINNVISNWYSLPDAEFMTRVEDLETSSMYQIRGFCVQSRKYETQAFMVDYFLLGNLSPW